MIAATVVCAIACIALVVAEWRHAAVARAVAKTTASLAFIVVGVLAATKTRSLSDPIDPMILVDERIIVAGLVLGAIGDVALLGKSSRAFMAGLAAFLCGHIAYVVACAQLAPPSTWLTPVAAAPIAIGLGALAWLWPRLGTMRVPVIAYVATIVAMMVGALAALDSSALPTTNLRCLALGAALFFASDLAVARDKFIAQSVVNRTWGLPAYYAGQLLIAWSQA